LDNTNDMLTFNLYITILSCFPGRLWRYIRRTRHRTEYWLYLDK